MKLSKLKLEKLKSGIKDGTKITLKLSKNVVSNSSYQSNFLHNLLLTNIEASKLRNAFGITSSANTTLSKIQLHKIGQSGRVLGILLGPLLKFWLSLMKNSKNHHVNVYR